MDYKFSIDYLRGEIDSFNGLLPSKAELEVEKNIYRSVDELAEHLQSGPFSVDISDVKFECFYHFDNIKLMPPPRHLYVLYSSARTGTDPNPKSPHYSRWSYYPMMDSMNSALLCIDDPMIQESEAEDLVLAWFYGTEKISYLKLSLEIVTAVCRRLHLAYENVIFFGSSSGGYCGIYAASLLKGSMAIAINPQIYIQQWTYTSEFEKRTGINLKKEDHLYRNDLISLIKGNSSKYVILFNAMSNLDWNSQLEPFCNDVQIFPHYGLNKKDNILLWIYHAKGINSPHNAFETRNIFLGIDSIAKRFYFGENPERMQEMALFINKCWEEYYTLRLKLYKLETPGEQESSSAEFFMMYLINTARIDVKLIGRKSDLKVWSSDKRALMTKPDWLQKNGVGYVITSYMRSMKLRLETAGEGDLQIKFMGPFVLNPKGSTRNIPYWIDYTSIKVDEIELLKQTYAAWHNEPYIFTKNVSGKNVFNLELSWKAHDFEEKGRYDNN